MWRVVRVKTVKFTRIGKIEHTSDRFPQINA